MIREAEQSRARIYSHPGTLNIVHHTPVTDDKIDDDFLVVALHVEPGMCEKIIRGEYVDFSKLIAKDKVSLEEDHRMEMVNKGGIPFWMPVSDREKTEINNIFRWDQAFRVYSHIYSKYHPHRGAELVKYSHVIHDLARTYGWNNVYHYDKDFRLHMGNHPECSWEKILQKAWSFRLKEKLHRSALDGGMNRYYDQNRNNNSREICKKFNRGKCNYGLRCKYDHRCLNKECGKWGHGIHNCRKLKTIGQGNDKYHFVNTREKETENGKGESKQN